MRRIDDDDWHQRGTKHGIEWIGYFFLLPFYEDCGLLLTHAPHVLNLFLIFFRFCWGTKNVILYRLPYLAIWAHIFTHITGKNFHVFIKYMLVYNFVSNFNLLCFEDHRQFREDYSNLGTASWSIHFNFFTILWDYDKFKLQALYPF